MDREVFVPAALCRSVWAPNFCHKETGVLGDVESPSRSIIGWNFSVCVLNRMPSADPLMWNTDSDSLTLPAPISRPHRTVPKLDLMKVPLAHAQVTVGNG